MAILCTRDWRRAPARAAAACAPSTRPSTGASWSRIAPAQSAPAGWHPARCCLRPVAPFVDRRLLFTYRLLGDGPSLMAPGPVFIHAQPCLAYADEGFPPGLRALPLAFEARASDSRVTGLSAHDGSAEQ